jgi:hypothetical protein
MSEILRRSRLYPIEGSFAHNGKAARWTGEKRPPRKGELYLSGAVIAAYVAPNDLSTAYHIAEAVDLPPPSIERFGATYRREPL